MDSSNVDQGSNRGPFAGTANKVGEQANKVGEQAKTYVDKGVASVTNAAQSVQDSAAEIVEPLIRYTKERPAQALLLAALAGAAFVTLVRGLTPRN